MKTKKVKIVETLPKRTEKEIEVVDKNYYISKYIEKAKEDKKSIIVEVSGGCVQDVYNLPEGYTYTLVDWDNYEEMSDEEFIDEMGDIIEDEKNVSN